MAEREQFKGRAAFIFAAVGSAVGLGNIWRFPYVAFENGGGAFIIPYLVALLTAGIPLLFLDYAIGHRHRGSPPLAYRRLGGAAEVLGWWQVGICFVIAVYYAVIIAWSVRYVGFSVNRAWGDDPGTFFGADFLQQSGEFAVGGGLVPAVAIPLAAVWVFTLVVHKLGVQEGIARLSQLFIPLLVVIFLVMVVRGLFLDGAMTGLDALFTPDWSALTNASVWIAAYGQIFFSLSVAFGIMLTYSSYLKRRSNLTGSGLVVAFSNSGFEILAGIGVFAALGFMATASGVAVADVAESGIGLAFIAFPTIISTMPGGAVFGVLFFTSLVLAGITSLVSIVQVVLAAVEDKTGMSRTVSVLAVGGAMALLSVVLFPTTTGLNLLDVVDNFANNFGIVGVALASVVTLGLGLRRLPRLAEHINSVSSFRVGRTWMLLVGAVTPIVLGFMFVTEVVTRLRDGYGEMPAGFVAVYGWGVALALIAVAVLLTLVPWRRGALDGELTGVEGGARP